MKRVFYAVILVVGLMFVPWAEATDLITGTGVRDSRHNLSTSFNGTDTRNVFITGAGTSGVSANNLGEVCVFCHTPHGADTSGNAPLWNKQLPTGVTFNMYTSPTMQATTPSAPVGVSLACLSCHSGDLALDTMRNRPGRGLFNDTAPSAGFTFNGTGSGSTMPAGITNLGNDLRDDHPISIDYAGGYGGTLVGSNGTYSDRKFNAPNQGNLVIAWFDSAGGASSVMEDNEVRLFNGRVECASCHNVHGTLDPSGTSFYETFLRMDNDGSALCLTCHVK